MYSLCFSWLYFVFVFLASWCFVPAERQRAWPFIHQPSNEMSGKEVFGNWWLSFLYVSSCSGLCTPVRGGKGHKKWHKPWFTVLTLSTPLKQTDVTLRICLSLPVCINNGYQEIMHIASLLCKLVCNEQNWVRWLLLLFYTEITNISVKISSCFMKWNFILTCWYFMFSYRCTTNTKK